MLQSYLPHPNVPPNVFPTLYILSYRGQLARTGTIPCDDLKSQWRIMIYRSGYTGEYKIRVIYDEMKTGGARLDADNMYFLWKEKDIRISKNINICI